MNIGAAIEGVKTGKLFRRSEWNDGAHIALAREDSSGMDMVMWASASHAPQVFHPSSPDLLADDWQEVDAA